MLLAEPQSGCLAEVEVQLMDSLPPTKSFLEAVC